MAPGAQPSVAGTAAEAEVGMAPSLGLQRGSPNLAGSIRPRRILPYLSCLGRLPSRLYMRGRGITNPLLCLRVCGGNRACHP